MFSKSKMSKAKFSKTWLLPPPYTPNNFGQNVYQFTIRPTPNFVFKAT